jgi:hypothetical protein
MAKGLQKYFDRSMKVLDRFGIIQKTPEESKLASLLNDVKDVDPSKVTAIARVMQYQGTYNELVRQNIEDTEVSTAYTGIIKRFDSIRDDTKNMVDQLKDGKIDFGERFSNWWMKLRRGSTHERFERIKEIYDDVTSRTNNQLEREDAIIEGYMDFRFALKGSETLSYELLEKQEKIREESQEKYTLALKAVDGCPEENKTELSELQLKRDEAERSFKEEDKKYQLIKDIADNLKVGYNVGEALVAKLQQDHQLKERVFTQAVTFMNTNEHVFTTMDAAYTAQAGLHEQTQTLEAMKDGANKGLEELATIGHEIDKAALKAGYGATINKDSLQKLVNSIVSFQESSYELIDQYRKQATENAIEAEKIVEDGKQRAGNALKKYLTSGNESSE